MTNSITSDDVHAALKKVRMEYGQVAVSELLKRAAGVEIVTDLKVDQYATVIAACTGRSAIKPDGSLDQRAIFAKWNSAGVRESPVA